MSVTPAQATEAHRILLTCDGVGAQKKREVLDKLIADSEARAAQQARDEDSQITHAHRNANILLRAEAERLNRIVSKFIATEDGTDWAARAEKAEAELAKEQARMLHLFHHESPMAEPGDTLNEWLAQIDAAMERGSQ